MEVEQFVMAYGVEQARLRAILPGGFMSLRPVLRINAEIRGGSAGYVEFNTAVEHGGEKGWLNIGYWDHAAFERRERSVTFQADHLTITFSPTGIGGSCPAEKDNIGCYFLGGTTVLQPAEAILSPKKFCDCRFQWSFAGGAHGVSTGRTIPAFPTPVRVVYPKADLTVENAAHIPCQRVLGSYAVVFDR